MYKILKNITFVKINLFGFWKAIRIKELSLSNGLLCWNGFRKVFPDVLKLLDEGKEVRMILFMREE